MALGIPPHLPQRRLRPLGDLTIFVFGELFQRGDGVPGLLAHDQSVQDLVTDARVLLSVGNRGYSPALAATPPWVTQLPEAALESRDVAVLEVEAQSGALPPVWPELTV